MTTINVAFAPSAKDLTVNPTSRSNPAADAGRRRTLTNAIAVWTLAGLAGLMLTAAPALADDCPNAALRAQNHSAALPDCRAYELVSSAFKEGFAPTAPGISPDGNAASYLSTGNFAGNGMGAIFNQYVARRAKSGWLTTSPNPSGPQWAANINLGAEALSPDLRSSVWLMRQPDESTDMEAYYLRGPDGTFTRIGPAVNPDTRPPGAPGTAGPDRGPDTPLAGVSRDLSHVLFRLDPVLIFPGDASTGPSLYEYVGTGNDRPRLVGVDNDGQLISAEGTCSGGISSDGRVIVFIPACAGSVWARVGGTTTINASASQCTRTTADPAGECTGPNDATYTGKADDGSRIFFTTTKQLVNGDVDDTSDLYACDIPPGTPAPMEAVNACASLIQVSGPAPGANVENVVRISGDGSSVYFLAQGILAHNQGANDVAAASGDHNLYLWQKDAEHPTGQTRFVARLDANVFASDTAATDDGRYLLISTSTRLVTTGPGADTDPDVDVYRYDAEAGQIVRLSIASSGTGGNAPGLPAGQSRAGAMTSDARTIIFETSEALSPLDDNTASDVYEWHDGRVSPITIGGGDSGSISASGDDIFFMTSRSVTDADGDTNFDIYDARIGGGFDSNLPAECDGDQCRGVPSAPPVLVVPPLGDTTVPGAVDDIDPSFSLQTVTIAQRKRMAATGHLVLTVTTNTPAILNATATATIGRRTMSVAGTRRIAAAPGTVKLALVLSRTARTQMAATGRLTVKLTVRDSKVALPRSTTLRLVHVKAKHPSKSSSAEQAALAIEKSRS